MKNAPTHQRVGALCIAIVLCALPAHAHHAASGVFSSEDIQIEGYVAEFNFKNPHVNIMLTVSDDNGVETQWMATASSAPTFRSYGWSADTVQPGQYLRLIGKKSRTGAPMILMQGSDIQSGKLLELDPNDNSIIRNVVGIVDAAPDGAFIASSPLTLDNGRPNLNGTWLRQPNRPLENPPYNEIGAALQGEFDPLNDPAFASCSEVGLVRQAAFTPHPLRITQFNDYVLLEYEEHAGQREIYLDGRGPTITEHSRFGYHVAHYEDDALVIESNQLLAGLTGPNGNALSEQTTTIERYRRIDNTETGPMLEMSMVISDPGHLTGPWNVVWQKIFATETFEFVEVECQLPLPPIQ